MSFLFAKIVALELRLASFRVNLHFLMESRLTESIQDVLWESEPARMPQDLSGSHLWEKKAWLWWRLGRCLLCLLLAASGS